MTVDQAERGCRAVCIAFLYLVGMLLIIAGIAAAVFTQTYPDLKLYLAIAAAAAIIMGFLFVGMSAVACTRKKPLPRKYSGASQPYTASPINNTGSRPDLILPLEPVTDPSKPVYDKDMRIDDTSDGLRGTKEDHCVTNSVGVTVSKNVQKPATSSPRLPKTKGPQSFNKEAPRLLSIPPVRQNTDNIQSSKPRSAQGKAPHVTGTSSISDFSSLAVSTDDVVFDSTPSDRGGPKPIPKGRGRVPLTAFKHASKSVSDLDDDVSLEPALKPVQRGSPRPARQVEPRLAVSCHNILSEEPVRVGIHHLRQREAVTKNAAAKPPVPRKVTDVALPGLSNQPKDTATSHSENDLRKPEVRLKLKPNAGARPTDVPRRPNVRYIPKSVPDLLNSSGDYDASPQPSKKTYTVTVISRSTNPLPASGAPCVEFKQQPADLERCNMIGLPLSLPPRSVPKVIAGASDGTAIRALMTTDNSQSEWAPSVSSRSNTISSDDSHGQFNSSQELLMEGERGLMETEI